MRLRFFLLSALLAAPVAAQTEEVRADNNRLPVFLSHYDTNEDGVIDVEEEQAIREYGFQLGKERRNSIDSDDDGIISQDEIKAARKSIRKLIKARRVQYFKAIAGEDDVISEEEFLIHPALANLTEEMKQAIFARLDADQNGEVTTEEFLARLRSHEAPTR